MTSGSESLSALYSWKWENIPGQDNQMLALYTPSLNPHLSLLLPSSYPFPHYFLFLAPFHPLSVKPETIHGGLLQIQWPHYGGQSVTQHQRCHSFYGMPYLFLGYFYSDGLASRAYYNGEFNFLHTRLHLPTRQNSCSQQMQTPAFRRASCSFWFWRLHLQPPKMALDCGLSPLVFSWSFPSVHPQLWHAIADKRSIKALYAGLEKLLV